MPRILVVDDQHDMRAMICLVLRLNRFEVSEAESAKAAWKVFAQASFDAALVDNFLQEASGLDLITAMRARVPDPPIVAVSGMTKLGAVAPSAELFAVVCLQKPFRPVELIGAIETAHGLIQSSENRAAAQCTA